MDQEDEGIIGEMHKVLQDKESASGQIKELEKLCEDKQERIIQLKRELKEVEHENRNNRGFLEVVVQLKTQLQEMLGSFKGMAGRVHSEGDEQIGEIGRLQQDLNKKKEDSNFVFEKIEQINKEKSKHLDDFKAKLEAFLQEDEQPPELEQQKLLKTEVELAMEMLAKSSKELISLQETNENLTKNLEKVQKENVVLKEKTLNLNNKKLKLESDLKGLNNKEKVNFDELNELNLKVEEDLQKLEESEKILQDKQTYLQELDRRIAEGDKKIYHWKMQEEILTRKVEQGDQVFQESRTLLEKQLEQTNLLFEAKKELINKETSSKSNKEPIMENLQAKIAEISTSITLQVEKIQHLEKEKKELEEKHSEAMVKNAQITSETTELLKKHSELKTQIPEKENSLKLLLDNKQNVLQEIEQSSSELKKQFEAKSEVLQKDLKVLEMENKDIQTKRENCLKELNELREREKTLKDERNAAKEEIKLLDSKIAESYAEYKALNKKLEAVKQKENIPTKIKKPAAPRMTKWDSDSSVDENFVAWKARMDKNC